MRLLIDCSVFLLLATTPERVPMHMQREIDGADARFFSAASAWEMSIKAGARSLTLPSPVGEYLETRMERFGMRWLPITHAHATKVEFLPWHHRDPFDRMLIAQAILEDLTLATMNRNLGKYRVRLLKPTR